MRMWKMGFGLALVFTGTSNIGWGIALGIYHLHVYGAFCLITIGFLSGFGALLFWLGKKLIATERDFDIGPQICLIALLGAAIGIVTTCANILLPHYSQICAIGKCALGYGVVLCIALIVCHFGDNSTSQCDVQQ